MLLQKNLELKEDIKTINSLLILIIIIIQKQESSIDGYVVNNIMNVQSEILPKVEKLGMC